MYASQTSLQHHLPNGYDNNIVQQQQPQRSPAASQPKEKESIHVVGIPAVHIQHGRLIVGSPQSSSTRSYTPLKLLGDGSFGSVWLCDYATLPPELPLSPMQCGAGARPEWKGKRLVAVKRMKKKWEGGWEECQKLKEIESLRAIPFHPNIIPLYDCFLLPTSKELYFVFESMEGNLYHLIKARKGRPLAGGLVSSIFQQIVSGLDHVHTSGYFHRDMKPENILVTTTGLFDYTPVSPIAPPNAPPEKDVVTIIKLADFGLARETKSEPPYTEYVSTRWYRAPEVLLLSRDYSNPVDMWALGTIMAELVNLRPLFPGSDTVDQVARICEVLGDPSDEYGLDSSNSPIGGGPWPRGIVMAQDVGFAFRKTEPRDIHSLFERSVPLSLIHCIRDLLKYDPDARLTSRQCVDHCYLRETIPRNNIPLPPSLHLQTKFTASPSPSHHSIPPSHSHPPAHLHPSHAAATSHRVPFFPQQHALPHHHRPSPSPASDGIQEESRNLHPISTWGTRQPSPALNGGDYHMDISPQAETLHEYPNGQPMDIVQPSPVSQEYSNRPHMQSESSFAEHSEMSQSQSNKLGKLSALSFGKKHSKWSIFGGDKSHHHALPPVHEVPQGASTSTPSLKRTQSLSSDKSLRDSSPPRPADVKKINKKEAERLQREAEKQRRALAEKMHREQARAVMQKRNAIIQKTTGKDDLEWRGGSEQLLGYSETMKAKQAATGPIRRDQGLHNGNAVSSTTVNAASGRFASPEASVGPSDWKVDGERKAKKARVREYDDDQSMSSSDVHSTGRMSSISFATVDSDPGPSRIRNRPSLFGLNRMQSSSSLRTSFDDFSPSARSSNSFSLEGQLANDFRMQASVNPSTPLTGNLSPPPMHALSLSPTLSPSLSPSPTWMHVQQHQDQISSQDQAPPYISMPRPIQPGLKPLYNPFDFNGHNHPPSPYGHPPSSGQTNKSDINPIFKVPQLPPRPPDKDDQLSSPTSLPPFSELEAVAGGGYDYPPLSPMSFTAPQEDM